ncbi:MAG: bifunctional UDP-N-acetylglucosamine pyrophosphorylase / glucosamine-phosphate N-acetyltransferase [Actinomycetota bacterium]|jgi:bifunctional UDP-N-acetylglucosamine pyrophosphorylase/glucosamine-1-phosphate N-acetyltransferase|nr:bifunctional UDP-N-acetylglucosamine pyrophosphorylase / glucosamine-phosphate N-acetyltransferase [Actinomycetota bacterium]
MTARAGKAVILAAGQGKRMGSDLPKVLHLVDGKPMVIYCLEASMAAGIDDVILVVGVGRDEVIEAVDDAYEGVEYAFQEEQLGTGHAVMQAREFLDGWDGNVAVLYGDMPMLTAETIRSVVEHRDATGAAAVVLTIELENPPDFGRVVRDGDGRVVGIVEARDATPAQLAVREVNVGAYCFDASALMGALDRLGTDNAQGEYYLTDVIGILAADGALVETVVTENLEETLGINDPEHLDFAEKLRHIRYAEKMYGRVDALARERRPKTS